MVGAVTSARRVRPHTQAWLVGEGKGAMHTRVRMRLLQVVCGHGERRQGCGCFDGRRSGEERRMWRIRT